MMDINDIIAGFAFGIGFYQMYSELKKSGEIDESSKNKVVLSLIASCLWLIYQSRKYGLNASTVYTSSGLLVQLYILNKILLKERDRI
jgi:hypothetical protein